MEKELTLPVIHVMCDNFVPVFQYIQCPFQSGLRWRSLAPVPYRTVTNYESRGQGCAQRCSLNEDEEYDRHGIQ